MGQPEQYAGASGQTREKKSRRSRKRGQKSSERASDKRIVHSEKGPGEVAAEGSGRTAKRHGKRDRAAAANVQVAQQLGGNSAEAPAPDSVPQSFDRPGNKQGKEHTVTNGAESLGPARLSNTLQGAPHKGEETAPVADLADDQHAKVGPDQKPRRNRKSRASKLLVYHRLGEYLPEEDEKKLDEVLAKKRLTEVEDKTKMAAEVAGGAGDVADVVQSPAAPPTDAVATDCDDQCQDSYYSILADIQKTVSAAEETLCDAKVEGELPLDDAPSFEAILKLAAAMESVDATANQDETQPSTPATMDAVDPAQVADIPEVPTSHITTAGTEEVSSSSSSHPKDSSDVDTTISHVAEKESGVLDTREDMEDDALVQDGDKLCEMSSDKGNSSPQNEVNVNDPGVTETEPKSTDELHSVRPSGVVEGSCEESSIPASPEPSADEVKESNTANVSVEQGTIHQEALSAPSAEDSGKVADDKVGETVDTDATTPASEEAPDISTAEAKADLVTPITLEDDSTEVVNEEDLLLNAEEGESIEINLPRHLSEEVEDTAIKSDMGNRSGKEASDEQPDSKQNTADDTTGVFAEDAADTSTVSPDNQSNLPAVSPEPRQPYVDEMEVTISIETPDTPQDTEEEPAEVPDYIPTPPPADPTVPPADPTVPSEDNSAPPPPQNAIVIGSISTLPDDIPFIDGVDEPEEGPDSPTDVGESTPLTAKVEPAPAEVPTSAEEEPLLESQERAQEEEPSTTPEEKPKKKKKRSKLLSCMFPCVGSPKEKEH